MTFDFPGTWRAVNTNEYQAANRERWQSCTSTTAVLSEQNSTLFADHWWSHRKAAKTIGKSSLWAMDKGICNGDHLPANLSIPKIAPYPTEPAASEETWRSGMGAQREDNRKLYPFQDWKNSSHHDKSKWNSLLSLVGWSSLRKAESRLTIWRRKVRSEGTTLHACWRLPI